MASQALEAEASVSISEQSEGSSERVKVVISKEDGLSTTLILSLLEALSLDVVILTLSLLEALSLDVVISRSSGPELSQVLTGGGSFFPVDGSAAALSLDLLDLCCLCLDDVEEILGLKGNLQYSLNITDDGFDVL